LAFDDNNEPVQKAREDLVGLLTPDQIAEAERMAREWMVKHQQ
jgi:hypothetical protein